MGHVAAIENLERRGTEASNRLMDRLQRGRWSCQNRWGENFRLSFVEEWLVVTSLANGLLPLFKRGHIGLRGHQTWTHSWENASPVLRITGGLHWRRVIYVCRWLENPGLVSVSTSRDRIHARQCPTSIYSPWWIIFQSGQRPSLWGTTPLQQSLVLWWSIYSSDLEHQGNYFQTEA